MSIGIFYAILTAILMSIGQIFFKKASIFNNQHENLNFFIKFLVNYWLIIGLIIFGLSTLIWVKALSGENLSRLYPLTSLAYIMTMILAYLFLGEKLTTFTIFGTILIFLGVIAIFQQ